MISNPLRNVLGLCLAHMVVVVDVVAIEIRTQRECGRVKIDGGNTELTHDLIRNCVVCIDVRCMSA